MGRGRRGRILRARFKGLKPLKCRYLAIAKMNAIVLAKLCGQFGQK